MPALRSTPTCGASTPRSGETTELTAGTSLIERPRISPDGTRVLFNVGHPPHANLFTMPITGGPMTQLTFLDSFNVGGVWSRDSAQVAFASTEGGTSRVWIVAADGGTPRPLSANAVSQSLDLTWSPGRRILFQQPGNRNYYALDPESRAGSARRQGWLRGLDVFTGVFTGWPLDCRVLEP